MTCNFCPYIPTKGSSSFLDYYKAVLGSTWGITITSLGLTFYILVFSSSVYS